MQPDAGYFREEPGAGKPPARICEGRAKWPSYSTTAAVEIRLTRCLINCAATLDHGYNKIHENVIELIRDGL